MSHGLAESLSLILKEIEDRYHGMDPPMRTPFSAILGHVASEDETTAQSFYESYLGDLDLSSPFEPLDDGAQPGQCDVDVECYPVDIAARTSGVTVHALIQSVFAITYGEYLGKDDIVSSGELHRWYDIDFLPSGLRSRALRSHYHDRRGRDNPRSLHNYGTRSRPVTSSA
jgi:hypothetical protein